MKIGLSGGVCGGRWSCANLNKKVCHPVPVGDNGFVECVYYKLMD